MDRFARLKAMMNEYGKDPVCVAFSGGVDSSLLLKLACESGARGGNPVYAVTFDSMLHPSCDLEIARRVAGELGAEHTVLQVDELSLHEIRNNPENRCYLCKRHLFERLLAFAKDHGCKTVMEGSNEDDLHVYRPGLRAIRELGIASPLAACHITKAEVKELAAEKGISVANRPSTPCMATRLPYGARLEYETLRRIEAGETWLRQQFGGNIRLRLHGEVARLELDAPMLGEALAQRDLVCRELHRLGFRYITLDLEGFRSGSMDSNLQE